jgi:hypothetical protein
MVMENYGLPPKKPMSYGMKWLTGCSLFIAANFALDPVYDATLHNPDKPSSRPFDFNDVNTWLFPAFRNDFLIPDVLSDIGLRGDSLPSPDQPPSLPLAAHSLGSSALADQISATGRANHG